MRLFALIILVAAVAANTWIMAKNRELMKHLRAVNAQADPGTDYSRYALIHMPPDGKCPQGFEVEPKIFHRGGRSYAGCLRPQLGSGGAIDVLKPGEGVDMILRIPLCDEGKPESPVVRQ